MGWVGAPKLSLPPCAGNPRYATGVTTALQNTAIVSERPHFFFEINESWYYVLNLPALH